MPDLPDEPRSGGNGNGIGLLTSWKEIAAFLGVSVRTAQTWEKEKGLPVRRIPGGIRPRVAADPQLVRDWLRGREEPDQDSRRYPWYRVRRLLLGVAGFLVPAGLAAFWYASSEPVPPPGPPVRLVREGDTIRAVDGQDREVWKKSFQLHEIPSLTYDSPDSQVRKDPSLLVDFDHDGSVEAVLSIIRPGSNPGGHIESVGSDGSSLWRVEPGMGLRWEEREFEKCFFVETGLFLSWSEGVPTLVAPARHCTFFPSQVLLLDPVSGAVQGEYWHPGHVTSALVFDLDGDAQDEVLLGGYNNPGTAGNGHAALVVLALSRLRGARFEAGDPFGFERSEALAYLLFPSPDVAAGSACGVITLYPLRPNRIVAHVFTARPGAYLVYTFDQQLNLLRVEASNDYLRHHQILFEGGELDHPFDSSELELAGRIFRCSGRNADGNGAEVRDFFGE